LSKASDGKDQPHAHIMLTLRPLKPDGSCFSNKERDWNKHKLLEHWRKQWATSTNKALSDANNDARIDHRTLKAQGIPCVPPPHLPYPIITGRIRQIADELTGRLNQWNAVRFRKLALQMLDTIHDSEIVPWEVVGQPVFQITPEALDRI
jgi:ATP-dependent exoDNAse (exonuclease V) alpha subunit